MVGASVIPALRRRAKRSAIDAGAAEGEAESGEGVDRADELDETRQWAPLRTTVRRTRWSRWQAVATVGALPPRPRESPAEPLRSQC